MKKSGRKLEGKKQIQPEKSPNVLEKIVLIILVLFSVFAMLTSFADAVIRPDHVLLVDFILGILILGMILTGIFFMCKNLPEKRLKCVLRIATVVILGFYIVEVFCIQVEPSVDLSHIIQQTREFDS